MESMVNMQTQQDGQNRVQNSPTLDRTAFSVVTSFRDADREDTQYWWTQPAEMRLRYLEQLRQLNYGHLATTRLQRFFEVVQRA